MFWVARSSTSPRGPIGARPTETETRTSCPPGYSAVSQAPCAWATDPGSVTVAVSLVAQLGGPKLHDSIEAVGTNRRRSVWKPGQLGGGWLLGPFVARPQPNRQSD